MPKGTKTVLYKTVLVQKGTETVLYKTCELFPKLINISINLSNHKTISKEAFELSKRIPATEAEYDVFTSLTGSFFQSRDPRLLRSGSFRKDQLVANIEGAGVLAA